MGKDPIKLDRIFYIPPLLPNGLQVARHRKSLLNGGTIMAGNQDMKSAEQTYSGFLGLMKWGTVATIAIAALVVFLIAG